MIEKTKIIPVFNQVDIHAARMYTREAARQIGMELIDQARISLATSSLAECLKISPALGSNPQEVETTGSQITIRFLSQDNTAGLQVEFTFPLDHQKERVQQQLEKVRTLVDEIRIDQSPEGMHHICLVKWCGGSMTVETGMNPEMTALGDLNGGNNVSGSIK